MDADDSGLRDVLLVWGLYAADTLAILVTYTRIPPKELYHVNHRGLKGGTSRALVFSNFSFSFVAIALAGFAAAHRRASSSFGTRSQRVLDLASVAPPLLCAVTAIPGVVDERKLDARPVNALPALGVIGAAALTLHAIGSRGLGQPSARPKRDAFAAAASAIVGIVSIPWILAELGIYAGDVPVLDRVVLSKQPSPANQQHRAVHLGHHHGMDGALLTVSALRLGRALRGVRPGPLRAGLSWYLSLMLAYGAANTLNDLWHEQVEKRQITDVVIPSMLYPRWSRAWGLLAAGTLLARRALFSPVR